MNDHVNQTDTAGSGEGPRTARNPAICIVVSRYNDSITSVLKDGAVSAYRERCLEGPEPVVAEAPGTFELPVIASAAVESGRFDGVVALGCVVRGETDHDRYISHAVANSLAILSAQAVLPVAFGVLTVNTPEQARARADGDKGNKGAEAMGAVLDSIEAMASLLGFDTDSADGFRIDREIEDKASAGPRGVGG